MKKNKKTGYIILCAAMLCGICGIVHAEIVDQILATVDKEAILQSDIMVEIGPKIAQLQQTITDTKTLRNKVDQLIQKTIQEEINNKILLRMALLKGMDVKKERIDERIDQLKKMYPSITAFQKELKSSGQTMGELRERIRKNLLAYKIASDKRKEFSHSVSVSESELAQYYEDHKKEFFHPERIRFRRIFLQAPKDPEKRKIVRARMEELRADLESGASFEELAKSFSDGPEAQKGGIVGWVSRGDLDPAVEKPLFKLQPGEISPVIETAYGFLLLKVDERQKAGQSSLEDVRSIIEPKLRAEKANKLFEAWLADLRKRSRVQVFYQ